MSKTNTKKSFAEEGLEAVQEVTTEAEANVAVTADNTSDDGELQQVGGLEPVAYFYRFSAPKPGKAPKQPFKILEKGTTIEGRYERSFVSGKFKNPTYLIRLTTGELVGVPSSGRFNKSFSKIAEGSKVKITYNGMGTIKQGEWEGSDAHDFTVFASKLKA